MLWRRSHFKYLFSSMIPFHTYVKAYHLLVESLNCISNLSEVTNNVLGSGFCIESGVTSENSNLRILLPVESPSNRFFDVWSHQRRNTTNMCLSVCCSHTLELNHVVLSQGKFSISSSEMTPEC